MVRTTIQYITTQYCTTRYCTVQQCTTFQCCTVRDNTEQCSTKHTNTSVYYCAPALCNSAQYNPTNCSKPQPCMPHRKAKLLTIRCNGMQAYTALYIAKPCCAIQHNPMECSTNLWSPPSPGPGISSFSSNSVSFWLAFKACYIVVRFSRPLIIFIAILSDPDRARINPD